jgi:hypothetical protein
MKVCTAYPNEGGLDFDLPVAAYRSWDIVFDL